MFGLTRLSPFDDIFSIQRDVDRVFNQFWNDLPARTASRSDFKVTTADDAWRIDVPLPGIDPKFVTLEVAGDILSLRAQMPEGDKGAPAMRYEQTLTVPDFLDTGKLTASHDHGMLRLTIPLKESVKPRLVAIESKGAIEAKGAPEPKSAIDPKADAKVVAAGAGAPR
jgi:HSP20 family molecular chaperone IbpA